MTSLPDALDSVSGLDLHMHSTASDGALSPSALVALCHARGVTHMALTDHDTIAGVVEAAAEAERLDLRFLPGAELSAQWQGVTIHVVALLPDGARGEDVRTRQVERGAHEGARVRRSPVEFTASTTGPSTP